jgi:hypothetical protein
MLRHGVSASGMLVGSFSRRLRTLANVCIHLSMELVPGLESRRKKCLDQLHCFFFAIRSTSLLEKPLSHTPRHLREPGLVLLLSVVVDDRHCYNDLNLIKTNRSFIYLLADNKNHASTTHILLGITRSTHMLDTREQKVPQKIYHCQMGNSEILTGCN